jgi:excisionase family DNA binding protein
MSIDNLRQEMLCYEYAGEAHIPNERTGQMGTLLNVKEAQARLGISESTLFRLLKSKELKGFKVGRIWKFEESDLEDFIKRQRAKSEQGEGGGQAA